MILTWLKAALLHLFLVIVGFAVTCVVIRRYGVSPGLQGADVAVAGLLCMYTAIAIIALLIPRASKWSCGIVLLLALLPAGLEVERAIREVIMMRYYLPYDRLRDWIVSPIPASVTNLHFVPPEEMVLPDVMLEFDIDPADTDRILNELNLEPVEPASLPNPKDFFRYAYYLPMNGAFQLFQGKDQYGNVLTIKANTWHSHVVFRKEDSSFYCDRKWEHQRNSVLTEIENEGLARLKARYEAAQQPR
jgi:hypothetical protein